MTLNIPLHTRMVLRGGTVWTYQEALAVERRNGRPHSLRRTSDQQRGQGALYSAGGAYVAPQEISIVDLTQSSIVVSQERGSARRGRLRRYRTTASLFSSGVRAAGLLRDRDASRLEDGHYVPNSGQPCQPSLDQHETAAATARRASPTPRGRSLDRHGQSLSGGGGEAKGGRHRKGG